MEASTADRPRRVDLGFAGGQILTLRMSEESYNSLRTALEDESARWHEVSTDDSRVTVDLAQVVYVRLDTEQRGVGFSSA